MSETEHHLEHAEHAQHAAHSPFDRRVTMTIAIIAAMLACVTLLSHRAHNETLALQIEAGENETKATNEWNHYQAKKVRQYMYEAFAEQTRLTTNADDKEVEKKITAWQHKADTYQRDLYDLDQAAKRFGLEARTRKAESLHLHHISNWYDMGELGIEIALVFCAIAVLTKRHPFWFGGIGVGVLGVTLATIGLVQQYLVH
jgi:ferric-dicitrate binding protein FerR (iron transport regulator)